MGRKGSKTEAAEKGRKSVALACWIEQISQRTFNAYGPPTPFLYWNEKRMWIERAHVNRSYGREKRDVLSILNVPGFTWSLCFISGGIVELLYNIRYNKEWWREWYFVFVKPSICCVGDRSNASSINFIKPIETLDQGILWNREMNRTSLHTKIRHYGG